MSVLPTRRGNVRRFALIGVVFLVGAGVGILAGRGTSGGNPGTFSETRESGWRFISPLLECDMGGATGKGLVPFGSALGELVRKEIASGALLAAAVYYRDLMNGPWFGANETEGFVPASLLKVPLMMAYYRDAERDHALLGRKLAFTKKFAGPSNTVQTVAPEAEIQVGNEYTVGELIECSIKYSDNQAASLLLEHANRDTLRELFRRLEVPDVFLGGGDRRLSAKQYATFFRILYNASFLSREMSEKALKLLSEAGFREGLVAGVPPQVLVAHKFGEAGSMVTARQIHDCGIVYHAVRPYLLCVMTRGKDFDRMTDAIREISAFVWKSVDEQLR